MKKEVYRSFEGKLDAENQGGYVISELNDFYEVEFFNVWGFQSTLPRGERQQFYLKFTLCF